MQRSPTDAGPRVVSRAAREFIGSDSGSPSSNLVPLHSPPAAAGHVRSVVQTEVRSTEGAALWVVKGFSKLDDKPGFCVFSPEFFMAGTWWKMQLFPSGGGRNDSASSEGHASLYLFATRAPAKAKYSLGLLKAPPVITLPGAPENVAENERLAEEQGLYYLSHGSTKSFGSPSEGWGFLKFFSRKQLMIGQWAARDEIRLEANVSVVTGIHHTADSRMPGGTHMSSVTRFQHDMSSLLVSGEGADVSFAVTAGKRGSEPPVIIKTHRLILCNRSSYFRAMLNSGMCESKTGRVNVEYCRPSVFKELLRFLYTGACNLNGVGLEEIMSHDDSIKSLEETSSSDVEVDERKVMQESTPEIKEASIDVKRDDKDDSLDIGIDEIQKAEEREESGSRRQQEFISNPTNDPISDAALELLCAADRFDAADLRGLCEHYLADTLSSLNCVQRCKAADQMGNLPFLRAMCIKFITELSPTVRTEETFKNRLHALPGPILVELMSAQPAAQPAPPPPQSTPVVLPVLTSQSTPVVLPTLTSQSAPVGPPPSAISQLLPDVARTQGGGTLPRTEPEPLIGSSSSLGSSLSSSLSSLFSSSSLSTLVRMSTSFVRETFPPSPAWPSSYQPSQSMPGLTSQLFRGAPPQGGGSGDHAPGLAAALPTARKRKEPGSLEVARTPDSMNAEAQTRALEEAASREQKRSRQEAANTGSSLSSSSSSSSSTLFSDRLGSSSTTPTPYTDPQSRPNKP